MRCTQLVKSRAYTSSSAWATVMSSKEAVVRIGRVKIHEMEKRKQIGRNYECCSKGEEIAEQVPSFITLDGP